MKTFLTYLACALVGLVIGLAILSNTTPTVRPAGEATFNRFGTAGTVNTSVSCLATTTLALAGSGSRQYFLATNDSTNNIYVCFGSTTTGCTASTGIRLNAGGGAFEAKFDNLYTGPITCVASATSTLTVTYNQ